MAESVATVPATTGSPVPSLPVGLAGDHRLVELRVAVDDHPSAGTRAPGRTNTTSPTTDRRRTRSRLTTLARLRSASSGSSSASACKAPCAWPMAFISCQWPKQHDGDQCGELPPELQVEPTERLSPSKRCTPRRSPARSATSFRAGGRGAPRPRPPRNGQPPQKKMNVPSMGPTQADAREVEVVAEPLHDHVRRRHDRQRQQTGLARTAAGTSLGHGRRACRGLGVRRRGRRAPRTATGYECGDLHGGRARRSSSDAARRGPASLASVSFSSASGPPLLAASTTQCRRCSSSRPTETPCRAELTDEICVSTSMQ